MSDDEYKKGLTRGCNTVILIDNITVLHWGVKMAYEESTTLQNILEAGKEEFLEKGFKSASLRNIVKTAGVTTGAFYGYFSGKEALFCRSC